jgi:hypothetical protein
MIHLLGVPVPPAHAVPVVVRKLVVEIMVALAIRQEGEPAIVAGAVLVAVGLPTEGMGDRVDEEGEVVADDQPQDAREEEDAPKVPVQPA